MRSSTPPILNLFTGSSVSKGGLPARNSRAAEVASASCGNTIDSIRQRAIHSFAPSKARLPVSARCPLD